LNRALIVGATSAIAVAVARRFATRGDALFLGARNTARLASVADDLRVRGASCASVGHYDATDYAGHEAFLDAAWDALGSVDIALIAHGALPDQARCEKCFDAAKEALEVNMLGVASLATGLANRFERQGHGTLAVVSSVAADRGRQSNYVYGAGKAAVDVLFQGLRNRLHRSGVHVLTIKPGFVDSPMTRDFDKGPLWVTPDDIARDVVRAIGSRREIAYVPRFWWLISVALRAIPERAFKRMSL
jgi:hypothetical protein